MTRERDNSAAGRPGKTTPVIGITSNLRVNENFRLHSVSEKYAIAVVEAAGVIPVYLPALGPNLCIESLLSSVDGVLLTGGASNIEPHHYGQEPAPGEDLRDPGRDNLVLPLIRRAIDAGIPLLGICRGIQEINVALGGTLHQRLHEVPGREDHRRPREKPWAEQLSARQRLRLSPDGLLARLAGSEEVVVNSLHGQGIDRVAERLRVEAIAEDGTIEAVSVKDAPGFAVGVQWHAEHDVHGHDLYRAIFAAFGSAARGYAAVGSGSTEVGQVA